MWNLKTLTKVDILRTIFWLTKTDRLSLDLTVSREQEAWNAVTDTYKIDNFSFDNTLNSNVWLDLLVWIQSKVAYDWNIASIQTNITNAWRFFRFKYSSSNRFIMWLNYLMHESSKPYVNDILTSN